MIRARVLRTVSAMALAAAVIPLGAVLAGPASATTFNVINNQNSGTGSLRQALADAASNPGVDVIDIQSGLATITVTSELAWSGSGAVTINGNGATLTGPGVGRGLVEEGGDGFTMNDLTVTGFGAAMSDNAAAVLSLGGPITLNGCSITDNAIQSDAENIAGGVLSTGGSVNITNCTITGNSATASDGDVGGGVLSQGGNVVIVTSTISGNTASSSFGDAGGGVLSEGGSVTVRDSTFNCNTATTTGNGGDAAGGILSEGGGITINGSTVVGNSATAVGAAGNALLAAGGGAVDGTGNTISDDTSVCAAPTPTPTPTPTPAPVAAPVQAAARFTG